MKNNFKFLQDSVSQKWVIIAPKRAKRPGVGGKVAKNFCPFCHGISNEKELFRIGPKKDWLVLVVENKFPFASIHEIVIHSPDHHKNFEELPLQQTEKILLAYQQRFQTHAKKGQVFIFNNHGRGGGESISHPHTQIVVVPFSVKLETPKGAEVSNLISETKFFKVFSPDASEWPWEVWIVPKKGANRTFASCQSSEILDLAKILKNLLATLAKKLGHEFPYNFYIYPGKDWYLRIMPRSKFIGGFELGAGIFVNSQDPEVTKEYLKKKLLGFTLHA